MAKYIIKGQTLTDIADKIREYTDPEKGYTPEEMPSGIDEAVLSTVLNMCKAEESGTAVCLHDVLDLPQTVKVKLRSKNLIHEQYDNYNGKMLSLNLEKGKTYTVSCDRPISEAHYLFLYNGSDKTFNIWN